MKILFLTLVRIDTLESHSLYPDLLRRFVMHGHYVRIVSASANEETADIRFEGHSILRVNTPQVTGVGMLKKGIATMLIAPNIWRTLKKYCSQEHFDLVLYSTPPITLASVVKYVKKRDNAKTYLLLKDIFPQNAVDLGMMSKHGIKAPLYWYFRHKEKQLYALSDRIGCMSQANVDYLLRQDPEIDSAKVEICPNSAEPLERTVTSERRHELREKYGIPQDKTVFLYGGNLGPVQGIPFLIECLRRCSGIKDAFFLICGSGTEFPKLRAFAEAEQIPNVKVLPGLPHDDYEDMVPACDVGMIFLDYRFTIPNFPSRLLSYMQARLPVLCCTDPNTDVGDVCTDNGFGWKCLSNDPDTFAQMIELACHADRTAMGQTAREYLYAHYTAEQGYQIITKE